MLSKLEIRPSLSLNIKVSESKSIVTLSPLEIWSKIANNPPLPLRSFIRICVSPSHVQTSSSMALASSFLNALRKLWLPFLAITGAERSAIAVTYLHMLIFGHDYLSPITKTYNQTTKQSNLRLFQLTRKIDYDRKK